MGFRIPGFQVQVLVSAPFLKAPVAQLDRVSPSEGEGQWFDSTRAHQFEWDVEALG